MMKDAISLLLFGLLMSAAAWFFWHVLEDDATNILVTVSLIVLAADNLRLRRRLRSGR